jgi:hypothetical protein
MSDTPLTPQQAQTAEQRAAGESYPHKVLVALDQDVNVDTGGLPDETISSRVRRIQTRIRAGAGIRACGWRRH